ncbi:hypothetical protein HPO96_33105 [Kribbella sandramycini]|uniref:Uncharacterized protein n=1 Tax=Kribbella sandramycini TaxID=60450 RepID=A0A7Y4L664_9ACTN|nr:hypothetical protein [Kribbella sandramycini]NOL45098.1 hypothetical protein [Kribbella sandramycini]
MAFAGVCGGVVERFGEPESRWLNHNEVLTAGATRLAVGQVLADYGWIWERAGIGVPIDGEAYYVVGVEANGNLTLAPRAGGRLLLFAPDHSFDDVTPLEGCPPYSLYTFDGVPDLGSWIEDAAESWLRG